MKVCILGLGYIGLPTAALAASSGFEIHGVDISEKVVKTINSGKIHIVEPDLDGLVRNVVDSGMLKADIKPCKADVYIIAVPTPFKSVNSEEVKRGKGNQSNLSQISSLKSHDIPSPDISYVEAAVRSIIPYLEDGNLIIIESTSPVGTTERMFNLIKNSFNEELKINNEKLEKQINGDLPSHNKPKVHIAYCPERVLPGRVIFELENNDRVIGGIDDISTDKACEFYSCFVKGELHRTNARTAEMCKLTENAFRDVNIAFANELSIICDKAEIDVYELIRFTNKHPRVNILAPGCGVGGHCIAVDPWFIVSDFKEEAKLMHQARKINDYKPEFVIKKIKQTIDDIQSIVDYQPSIACLGLAFKPDIDDLRESPALYITKRLIDDKYNVIPVEPNIKSHKDISIYSVEYSLEKADIIVILVGHREFKKIDFTGKKLLDFTGSII